MQIRLHAGGRSYYNRVRAVISFIYVFGREAIDMIKADIVRNITGKLQLKDKEALIVIDGIVESLKDVICEHHRLEIRDFGVFQIKKRKQRIGRNPRDKKEYPIPSRQVVTFRIGKELKDLSPE
jgi:DNA-binding protein HU-beta